MTILANARHEAFARAIVKGKSAAAAYVAAGYKADDGNAIRLTGNDRVAARIAELKEQAAQGAVMAARETLERISARARDQTKGHEALQLRALELMGKHHELFTEKHKHDVNEGIADRLNAAWERMNAEKARARVNGRAK
jgi:hypothetical protein